MPEGVARSLLLLIFNACHESIAESCTLFWHPILLKHQDVYVLPDAGDATNGVCEGGPSRYTASPSSTRRSPPAPPAPPAVRWSASGGARAYKADARRGERHSRSATLPQPQASLTGGIMRRKIPASEGAGREARRYRCIARIQIQKKANFCAPALHMSEPRDLAMTWHRESPSDGNTPELTRVQNSDSITPDDILVCTRSPVDRA
jgi:hypothetical protein